MKQKEKLDLRRQSKFSGATRWLNVSGPSKYLVTTRNAMVDGSWGHLLLQSIEYLISIHTRNRYCASTEYIYFYLGYTINTFYSSC